MMAQSSALDHLRARSADSVFARLYGDDPALVAQQQQRYAELGTRFRERYGSPSLAHAIFVSCSGRLEAIGNHNDNRGLKVLGCSISQDTIFFGAPNDVGALRFHCAEFPELSFQVSLEQLSRNESDHRTIKLVKGSLAYLAQNGVRFRGADFVSQSVVGVGKGTSSSASWTMGMLGLLNFLGLGTGKSALLEMAKAAQYAENHYVGKGSGLLDQLACAHGGGVFLDFADLARPRIVSVPIEPGRFGYSMLLIDTHSSHADGSDEYSQVPAESNGIAAAFGKNVIGEVSRAEFLKTALGDPKMLGDNDRAVLRAMNGFAEDERVVGAVQALQTANWDAFLGFVTSSGIASETVLQNGYDIADPKKQGVPLTLQLLREFMCEHFPRVNYGLRLHGGGFGGTVLFIAPQAVVDTVRTEFNGYFERKYDLKPGTDSCQLVRPRAEGLVNVSSLLTAN